MRVLHVIDRLNIGGAERLFVNITSLLKKRGIDTTALLFNAGYPLDEEMDPEVPLVILNRKNKYSLAKLWKVNKICRKYDLVVTHLRHVYAYIKQAKMLFGGKYKLVIHDHSRIDPEAPLRLRGMFKPKYYIGVSSEQTAWAEGTLEIPGEKIYLLENMVEYVAEEKLRTVGSNRMMMVANVRRVKNIEYGIALADYMKRPLDIYGNLLEPDYYEMIKEKVADSKYATLIEGVNEITEVYDNYEVAVHCARSETGPLVLIEYLANGIPFVAYKTGSVADLVSEELPMLFIDNYDMTAWKQRIEEVSSMEGLPARMKQAFKEHFSAKRYIDKCLDIYEKILY